MFRVVKPGGTVGMANWGPDGPQGEMFEGMAKYWPALPEGGPRPRQWGVEEVARERLEPHASSLQMERASTRWEFESFEHAMETIGPAGPSPLARQAMSDEQREAMRDDARSIMERHNKASDGRLVVEPQYLQVVARKRG